MMKRAIKGMLPYGKPSGKTALKRVKVYIGIPEEFQGKDFEVPSIAKLGRMEKRSYMTLDELSKSVGAK
jgi:large subunit ribosomal protein L13